MSQRRITVVLDLDTGRATAGAKRASRALNPLTRSVENLDRATSRANGGLGAFGKRVRDVSVSVASLAYVIPNLSSVLFFWQRQMITSNAELERSIAIMKNFSKETTELAREQEARSFVDILVNKARNAPFALNALTDAFVKMKSAGIDPLEGQLDSLANAVAAFGGNDVTLKRASVAIQQMAGKGVISMEELRQQLGEAVPQAANLMARSLGVTYATLVKQISLGNVSALPALKAMSGEMERQFFGAASSMMGTWSGVVSRFKTELDVTLREMGKEQGYFQELKSQIIDLTAAISGNEFKRFVQGFSEGMATALKVTVDAVKVMYEYRKIITDTIIAFAALSVTFKVLGGLNSFYKNASVAVSDYSKQVKRSNFYLTNKAQLLKRQTIMHKEASEIIRAQSVAAGRRHSMFTAMSAEELASTKKIVVAKEASFAATQKQILVNKRLARSRALLSGGLGILGSVITSVVVAGLLAWANSAKQAKDETKEAVDQLIRAKGLNAGLEDVGRLDQAKKELAIREKQLLTEEQIKSLAVQRRVDTVTALKSGPAGNSMSDEVIEGIAEINYQKFFDQLTEKNAEILKYAAQLENITVATFDSAASGVAQSLISGASANVNVAMREVVAKYKSEMETVDEMVKAAGGNDASLEAAREEQLKSVRSFYTKQRTILTTEMLKMVAAQQLINKDTEEGKADFEGSGRAIQEYAKLITGAYGEMTRARTGMDDTVVNEKDGATKIDLIGRKLQELKFSISDLQEVGTEADRIMARFLSTISEETINEAGNTARLAAVRQQVELQIKLTKEMALGNALQNEATSYLEKLRKETAKSNETQALQTIGMFETNKGLGEYNANLKKLKEQLLLVNDQRKAAEIQTDIEAIQLERNGVITRDNIKLLSQVQAVIDSNSKKLARSNQTQSEYYLQQAQLVQENLNGLESSEAGYNAVAASMNRLIESFKNLSVNSKEAESIQQSALTKLIDGWGDFETQIDDVRAGALSNFTNAFGEFLQTGKFDFSSFANSIIADITRMIAKMIVMNAIQGTLGSMFSGFGGTQAPGGNAILSGGTFAMGGIMDSAGPRSLSFNKYANGGVANSPQLALFGEGDTPEAYVPLPDGRTIPVTMKGGGGDAVVNIHNNSSQPVEGTANSSFDGEKMVVDIMIKNLTRPSPVRQAVKEIR